MGLDFNDLGISGLSVLTEPEKHGFDWPEPEPLKKIAAPLPYPITSLPPGIEAAVTEVLAFVQCPDSLAASSALSALSLAGQGLADVRRDDRLSGPLSLYFLSVAESGERKCQWEV
jgi:putative DNA primase/helicase